MSARVAANTGTNSGDNDVMHNKLAATLVGALAATALPFLITPAASAEVCGEVGLYVRVGGCTDLAADAVVAGAAAAGVDRWGFAVPYPISEFPAFRGEAPCISPSGLPYYTPGDAPCYPV